MAVRSFIVGLMAACMFATSTAFSQPPVPIPSPEAEGEDWFVPVESHFDRLIYYSMDTIGSTRSGLWSSSIDVRTNEAADLGLYPDAVSDPKMILGSNCYWDQPAILAAYEIGKRSGCKCYYESADSYLRSFLFLGYDSSNKRIALDNKSFYDFKLDAMQRRDCPKELSKTHTPAWECFWRIDQETTTRQIMARAETLKSSASTTEVCIALDSLAWLAQAADDESAKESAVQLVKKIADRILKQQKSFGLEDGPLLAASLLRAGLDTSELQRRIDVDPGADLRKTFGSGPSGLTASFRAAEACLTLYENGKDERYIRVIEEVAQHARSACDEFVIAETYGRAIHFLERAANVLDRPEYRDSAKDIGKQAIKSLHDAENGMFRSRVGGKRCDAADGPGWLFLALMYLDGDDATAESALHF